MEKAGISTAVETEPAASTKRIRLTADVRRKQILDAALEEFSAVGFEGATVDAIARRVGLKKAGLYAHFKSKSAIFDELLATTIFSSASPRHWHWVEGSSLEETVDRYLDAAYSSLSDPRTQAIFRLLISESGRAPDRVRRWHAEMLLPHSLRRQSELDEVAAKFSLPDTALSRNFALASAPALLALVTLLLVGEEVGAESIAEIRRGHRDMLLSLLQRSRV